MTPPGHVMEGASFRVGVVVPAFNAESFIDEAIHSAMDQTRPPDEIIVVDDGSNDRTAAIAMSTGDERVTVLRQANGGVASALNSAFTASRSDILCLLDADDMFLPTKIERICAVFAQNPDVGLVGHRLLPIDAAFRMVGPAFPRAMEAGDLAAAILENHGTFRHPPASGLSFRRSASSLAFPLPTDLRVFVDGYLAAAVGLAAPVLFLRETLSLYRVHESNMSGLPRANAASIRKARVQAQALATAFHRDFHTTGYPTAFYAAELDLALAIVEGTPFTGRRALLAHLPREPRRRHGVWWLLILAPTSISRRALGLWWGRSVFRLVLAPIRSFLTAEERAGLRSRRAYSSNHPRLAPDIER